MARVPALQPGLLTLSRRRLLPRRVWSRLQPMGDVKIPVPGGHTVVYRSRADDQFARRVVWPGFEAWEGSTVAYVAGIAGDVRGFWDVGAHTGVFSLIVAAVNPSARIRAFEPNPAVVPLLLGNLAANGLPSGILVPVALSDVTGVAHLEVPGDVTAAHVATEGVEIRTMRGDDVDDGSAVGLVKIDVEGHELEVLRGMERVLRRCRPALVIEVGDDEHLAGVRALLAPLGYPSCSYFTRCGLVTVDTVPEREGGQPNFLFLAG
jgi:FkbM family methyltransferase